MNKKTFSTYLVCLFLLSGAVYGQKYKSVSSMVHFFSDAPMENIEATNNKSQSALNLASGEIVFSIPINGFVFEKSLMQEHFNENYMESGKYPKATFIGKISEYDLEKVGTQMAIAKGKMIIHGETQDISVEGDLTINEEGLEISAKFPVKLEDYKIKIPKVVFYNIAEIVEVTVNFNYEKID